MNRKCYFSIVIGSEKVYISKEIINFLSFCMPPPPKKEKKISAGWGRGLLEWARTQAKIIFLLVV